MENKNESIFEKLVAVTGMQGIFKVVGSRTNGLILEDLDNGKRKFAPLRLHQFSPLESIAIFTYDDAEPLKKVLQKMSELKETYPAPDHNAPNDQLLSYFRQILPNFDEDKVKISDIKKVIKWHTFLERKGLISSDVEQKGKDHGKEEE